MKFQHGTRRRALEYEKDWVQRWKADKTFEKSIEQRPLDNSYVFYDGPPFISGNPHHGTLLSSIVKDAVPRYQTMKGKRVERVWGWDCHGLPAERFTEKKLGLKSREEVIDYGLEKYIIACRNNMVQTSSEWNDVVDRIGRWVDMDNAYKTMDKNYMESVWWAFKELYEKGKIYEGDKVLMYCTLDATPLSKAEVTMDAGAYQDVTDPSVYVKFKLDDGRTLLAWTTTPWTLPANTALAINKDLAYVEVTVGDEQFILAKNLLEKVLQDEKHQPLAYKIVRELKGDELVGLSYEPLLGVNRGENAHKVWAADYVSSEDGTGIVHLAPAYGEEDFELARREKIPVVHTIDENGYFTEGDWTGQNVWETNKQIAKDLKERGVVWKIEYIRHSYPHCHRCGTRLMYRAHPSWFMDINGQRKEMIANNEPINWFPPHVKHGRFEKNIEQAPDWNLSRDRFWATAMPVWKSPSGKVKVVGSYAELKELSGVELEDYHRPWIDDVTFEIDGEVYTRIDKVMDCWFESGSMPFAQFHYPFENKEKFEANFPGDFIVEYIGQVRAWFYYVHAVNTALFGTHAFNNVIVTGNVAGNDGRKMSKSYGNYTDPNELMDKFSADSLRFLLLSSPLLNGEDFALQDKEVGDVARKLSMVWNMYDFFTMYAEVDGWEYDPDKAADLNPDDVKNPLDKWVISRVHQLNQEISMNMDGYNIPDAMSPILPFLDDASNWFVRRSRRRFWKSEDDDDKAQAYRTLHYVLLKFAVLVAPFTPFLAEELYQNLGGGVESVHLLDWPTNYTVDEAVLSDMERVRSYINEGLSIRAREGLKVRQPLASVRVPGQGITFDFAPILTEELNVKAVEYGEEVALDTELTPELKREGMAREVIRHVQSARKVVGLQVDDRIGLTLATDNEELKKAIEEFRTIIETETLAHRDSHTRTVGENDFHTEVKVDGSMLSISLAKEENA
jgi:isoleucyl-tRNA synthetase